MEGYVAILMPVLLIFVIFFFVQKMNKDKYNAIIQISKNIEDQSKIKDLLEDLEEKKKPIDYRRSGVITFFVGLGLLLFGAVSFLFQESSLRRRISPRRRLNFSRVIATSVMLVIRNL